MASTPSSDDVKSDVVELEHATVAQATPGSPAVDEMRKVQLAAAPVADPGLVPGSWRFFELRVSADAARQLPAVPTDFPCRRLLLW
jgi:hypothetical protein